MHKYLLIKQSRIQLNKGRLNLKECANKMGKKSIMSRQKPSVTLGGLLPTS